LQKLFSDGAGSNKPCGKPGTEMSPTPVILIPAIFVVRHKVGMTGARNASLLIVIPATRILVLKKNHDWRPGGSSVKQTRLQDGEIFFLSGCGAFLLSAFASFQVGQHIAGSEGKACGATVNDNTYRLAMRFAKNV
jgi:hypothetical protein